MNTQNTATAAFCLSNLESERNRAQSQTNEILRKMYNRIADLWLEKLQSLLNQN